MPLANFLKWSRERYGEEFAKFLWTDFNGSPKVCPNCGQASLCKLWIGNPAKQINGRISGKWYKWCELCLKGIYCPPGAFWIPDGVSFISDGDDVALQQALPANLQLIAPNSPSPLQEQTDPHD